ncbi:MAG: phenylalanine--tRNA ligase subunit alpha [Parcubacteria group bacterium]|nr:phenylalanine--tRNA ligase subunit alpha [Parcubacteria group bacterium]
MLDRVKQNFLNDIEKSKDLKTLENIYKKYLGRKGELTKILRSLKDLSEKERKEKGKLANNLRQEIEEVIKAKSKKFFIKSRHVSVMQKNWIDVTAPGKLPAQGHLHPITLVQQEIEEIFQSMGFSIINGPEVETEHYNFDALNVPKNHPARDLWDTFWLKDIDLLLRTHTSPMQARYMEKNNPPLRIIVPGRCFRHEATDASHETTFHQIEGLMIGQNISMANLKGVLEGFMKRFYGPQVKLRWQPSYFPFTEPGLELLMGCSVCGGKGCSTCGQSGWMEVIPCGMVHPNVFKSAGYVLERWQGFAFGMGLDRIAMMKHKIDDIRLFYSNDLRFLNQF